MNESDMGSSAKIGAILLSSLHGGKVAVTVNGRPLAELRASVSSVELDIGDGHVFSILLSKIPRSTFRLQTLHALSKQLNVLGTKFSLYDSEGLVLSAGKGVRSVLGRQKISLRRLMRLIEGKVDTR